MIVVGIDGANREALLEPARRGALPNVKALLESGVGGELWSVTTSSAAAWTAHLTGLEPEDTGITGFMKDGRFVRTEDIEVLSYPELLDDRGEEVGLLNFPITYPGLSLENGYSVPGQLTPLDTEIESGNEVIDEILDEVDYEVDVQYGDRQYSFVDNDLSVPPQRVKEDVERVERKRLDAARRALDRTEWDLFFVAVNGTDPMQHVLWDELTDAPLEETSMYDVYQLIDEFVGHLRSTYPDEPVLLFSDHGFRLDVWGGDDRTRRRWRKIRAIGSKLFPDTLKQTRLRALAVDLLAGSAELSGTTSGDQNPGSHDPAGVWVLGGAGVEPHDEERAAQFLDLPPTILHQLEHPVPNAYPGSVLSDALTEDRPVKYRDLDLSTDRRHRPVTEAQQEQLAHLGYVEMVEGDGDGDG